jgi:hypothetical protein
LVLATVIADFCNKICQTETFTSLRTALDASDVTLRQGNALFWFADIERVVSASRRHAIGVA